MRKVVFDPGSSIAQIDWFYLSPGTSLTSAVAAHVARTARLKRGDWSVHIHPSGITGCLVFRGKKDTLNFKVEGRD